VLAWALILTLSGLVIGWEPAVALIPVVGSASVLLIGSAAIRGAVMIFGGLAVLQSSASLTTMKLAYLAAVGIGTTVALVRLGHLRYTPPSPHYHRLVYWSLLLGCYVLVTFCVSVVRGADFVAALRDATPYLLFALAPIIAFDLSLSVPPRVLRTMLLSAGLIATVGFAVEWLGLRGFADLSLNRVAFPSFLMAGALFSYAASASLHGPRRRFAWLLIAGAVLSLLLVAGSRTSLVFLLAPLAMVVGMKRSGSRHITRLILFGLGTAAAVGLLLPGLMWLVGADVGRATERLGSVTHLLTNPMADQSFVERVAQTILARDVFLGSPLLGGGLGHSFSWTTFSGEQQEAFNIDSPLSVPAKFGIVGLFLLSMIGWHLLAEVRRQLRRRGVLTNGALLGYLALAGGYLLVLSPFEDKGFSFGLILLIALALPAANSQRPPAVIASARGS
jgi:hypothetical protein